MTQLTLTESLQAPEEIFYKAVLNCSEGQLSEEERKLIEAGFPVSRVPAKYSALREYFPDRPSKNEPVEKLEIWSGETPLVVVNDKKVYAYPWRRFQSLTSALRLLPLDGASFDIKKIDLSEWGSKKRTVSLRPADPYSFYVSLKDFSLNSVSFYEEPEAIKLSASTIKETGAYCPLVSGEKKISRRAYTVIFSDQIEVFYLDYEGKFKRDISKSFLRHLVDPVLSEKSAFLARAVLILDKISALRKECSLEEASAEVYKEYLKWTKK